MGGEERAVGGEVGVAAYAYGGCGRFCACDGGGGGEGGGWGRRRRGA